MPDSTRVTRVVFPRTDFPQLGWIQTSIPAGFNPLDGAAVWSAQQGGSFRTRDRYGRLYRTVHFDARYGGQGVELSIVERIPALAQLRDSYRSDKRLARFDLPGWPDDAWITENLTVAFDPTTYVGPGHLLDSYRSAAIRRVWETDQPAFLYPDTYPAVQLPSERPSNKPPRRVSDAVYQPWTETIPYEDSRYPAISQLLGERSSRGFDYRHIEQPNTDWIFPNLPTGYDPTVQYPGIQQLVEWYRARDRRYFTNDWVSSDWIFSILPAFDPTLSVGAFQQLLGSIRAGKELDRRSLLHQARYGGGGIELSIVERLPAILQLLSSGRTPAAKRAFHLLLSDPDLGWLFTSIPPAAPFDPVNFSWAIAADRMVERPKHPQWLAQRLGGGAAILDVARTWSAYEQLLSSFRSETSLRDVRQFLTEPAAAWIFTAVPPFDPRNFPWPIVGERTRERQKLLLALQQWSQPESSWIFQNLPVAPEGIAAVLAQAGLEVSFRRRSVLDVRADLWSPQFGWITVYVPAGAVEEGTKFYMTPRGLKAMGRRRR